MGEAVMRAGKLRDIDHNCYFFLIIFPYTVLNLIFLLIVPYSPPRNNFCFLIFQLKGLKHKTMSAIVLVYVSETILWEKFEEFLSLEIEIMEDDRRFKTPASF